MTRGCLMSSQYILLTPTSASGSPTGVTGSRSRSRSRSRRNSHAPQPLPPPPQSKLQERKLSQTLMRRASKGLNEPDAEDDHTRTETEQSSVADEIVPNGDDEEMNSEEEEDEEDGPNAFGKFPTYVCELHDPKPILIAERVSYNRIEISLFDPPVVSTDTRTHKKTSAAEVHADNEFQYEISVGNVSGVFHCTPQKVLEVYKTLSKDRRIADQLQFTETNYLQEGLLASLKRLYTSPAKVSDEIVDVLESISDIDAVLLHPAYVELIGATKGSELYTELESLIAYHKQQADPENKCMCEIYRKSVARFGDFYKEYEAATNNQTRYSTVASESFMWTRGILSFYTDTIYLMDKREFRPTHGLKKCSIYGFGRIKLFDIVRVSRKEWTIRASNFGHLYTLTLEKYVHRMNTHHMVAIKRCVPDSQNGGFRQENVCYVKKSKKYNGYRCLLMAEVISRGKVTTAISIQRTMTREGTPQYHYSTMSEISDATRESICSSTLSVPADHHKHLQRLHIGGGSDVVAFAAIAASYDILVGALTYWMERKY